MVRKKVEGDEEQRRAAAREARRAGDEPSARSATTGASKQRTHRSGRSSLTHEEKLDTRHQGKQRAHAGDRTGGPPAAGRPGRTFQGRGRRPYGEEHERVLRALATAEERHPGRAVRLQEISRTAGLPEEKARVLLHDLVAVHRLATEIQDSAAGELGPRYEAKPRR